MIITDECYSGKCLLQKTVFFVYNGAIFAALRASSLSAVAGERVLVRIEKAGKTWAAGKIVRILEKSPHRVNRECPVAKLCGGCDFWHMDYAEETRLKAERVRTCLNRLAGEQLAAMPILAAPDCHGYRNKAQYPVAYKKGRAYAGFFRAGTHTVVENKRCLHYYSQNKALTLWKSTLQLSEPLTKTLSYIFVDRHLCGLYNENNKWRDPFVRK